MKYLKIRVKDHQILHGFNTDNTKIIEEVKAENYTDKIIAMERILSISEKYILTTYAFDRLVYWEYEGKMDDLAKKLNVI